MNAGVHYAIMLSGLCFFSCVDRYTAATDDGGNAAGEDFRGYVGVEEKSKMVCLVA